MPSGTLWVRPRAGKARFSARPFVASTAVMLSLVVLHQGWRMLSPGAPAMPLAKREAEGEIECRLVRTAADQCAFVRANCEDEAVGLLPYLTFYYCTMQQAQTVAFVALVVWLGLLFTTIGIAASDFFSINLNTIAGVLGLSESLAGVTFLAFGNGSPDVFSTFAAMGSNSGSMAVGELIGAAGFITGVVAGSMALVREFPVSRRAFVRDILFFIVSVLFAMVFMADGRLWLWECIAMIGFYAFYVATVVGWHWVATRRKRQRAREAVLRGDFYGGSGAGRDELAPYRDDGTEQGPGEGGEEGAPLAPDDTAPVGGRPKAPPVDISALERGPRIEIDSVESPGGSRVLSTSMPEADEDEDARGRQLTAEMTSSMRVNRPRGRRSTTAMTPIRPSLLGALEFRSVLSSLQKSGTVRLAPLDRRGATVNRQHRPSLPEAGYAAAAQHAVEFGSSSAILPYRDGEGLTVPAYRDRALSSGDIPHTPTIALAATTATDTATDAATDAAAQATPATSPRTTPTVLSASDAPTSLRLQIPARASSPRSSPSLSPFPSYAESPLGPPSRMSSFGLPGPAVEHAYADLDGGAPPPPKPVRWWPYRVLPPPHIIAATLFPTLQGWREKTVWDRFVSLISVPTVFLLVTTLPVVEMEAETEDEDEDEDVDDGGVEADDNPDGEWQRYRRSTSVSRPHSRDMAAALAVPGSDAGGSSTAVSLRSANTGSDEFDRNDMPSFAAIRETEAPRPVSKPLSGTASTSEEDAGTGWSRWLVIVQLFAGPQFTVFVIWANTAAEDSPHPGRVLARFMLWTLAGSLVMLAVLLATTTAERRPRYHSLLCFLGFVISVAWISTVAGEVVGVLKAIGVVANISEAILGLTIFAVGNSLGDLVADITVARLGYPVMALAACFGGPMLNILLGVGIGGVWMTTKTAASRHQPYELQVGPTLLVSAVTVLVTLVTLLIAVPLNRWVLTRRIGLALISLWTVSTLINVIVEVVA